MRLFPILLTPDQRSRAEFTYVPWDMLAPHEERARLNHGRQTLEQLAGRGGLDPAEMVSVLEDRAFEPMPLAQALRYLKQRIKEFKP